MEHFNEQNRLNRKPSDARPSRLRLTVPAGMSSAVEDTPAPLFDFGAVLRMLRRRIGIIIVAVAACLGLAVFFDSLVPNTYTANSRILLDEEIINPFGNDDVFSDLNLTNPVVESQMQLIRSSYLLSRVVDDLGLDRDPNILTSASTPMSEKLAELRERVLPSNSAEKQPSETERFQAAVKHLRDNLRVTRNAQTLVIRLSYSSTSPEFSARVVNAVADTYIRDRLLSRQQTASRASVWFDERIAELNDRAFAAEQRIEQLRNGGELSPNASSGANALSAARSALQAAISDRARAQTELARLRTLSESEGAPSGVPPDIGSDLLVVLAEDANAAREALADSLEQTPSNTEVVERLRARIEELEAKADITLDGLLNSAAEKLEQTLAVVAEAEKTLAAVSASNSRNVGNSMEVELRSLEGEVRTYRRLHDQYLESYLNTVQQQNFPSSEATIIETAVLPEFPDGPGLRQIGLIALLMGLSVGAAGAFLVEAADGTIRTTSQLARSTQAQLLGLLPISEQDSKRWGLSRGAAKSPAISPPRRGSTSSEEIIALPENRMALMKDAPQLYAAISHPLSTYSESIRRVNVEADTAWALLGQNCDVPANIVAFISDGPSHGRSIAAMNYSEMLALGGGRTLLIDLDWTETFLTESIAPLAHAGFAELAAGDKNVMPKQAFWYDERTSLHFLPNRSMGSDATLDPGAFNHSPMIGFISALSGQFDQIVLDLSPLSRSSDPAALTKIVMGYVVVADWGITETASLAKELHRAAIRPPSLLGTLLNGVSQKELDRYETAA